MNNESKHTAPIELLSRFLAEEANAEERMQVEQWRDASDENRREFQSFVKLWSLTETAKSSPTIDLNAEWEKLDKHISVRKTRVISFQRLLQIAASVVVFMGLAYLVYNQSTRITTKSQLAQVQTIHLPDGSTITLNAASKISYAKDFGKSSRNITLKGEAFFSVAKNADVPFIIDAQGASIKVVGTRFNVKAYTSAQEVKVTVLEGTVQLFDSKQPQNNTLLVAGETGFYAKKNKGITKKAKLNTNDVAWKTFKMNFENTPLVEVAAIIENTYHVSIEIADAVKDCRVTVEFDQKDLASVLKVLQSTLDLRISKEGDILIFSGEGC